MNAADRKLITECLSTVAGFGELPYGLTAKDMAKRGEAMSSRMITAAGDAAFMARTEPKPTGEPNRLLLTLQ